MTHYFSNYRTRKAKRCIAIRGIIMAGAMLLAAAGSQGAEYFVTKEGNDANGGTSRKEAFATLQKGVDALTPGDTLTIGPGEYSETIKKNSLGSADQDTVIRAEIPGTVLVRGDIPLPGPFQKTKGYRFIYETTWDTLPQAVNELDTLSVLSSVPGLSEVEALPGSFYYDEDAKKLYLSTKDQKAPGERQYTASVIHSDGIYFGYGKRLIIDGLAVTGFNSTTDNPWVPEYRLKHSGTWIAWGILIARGENCTIRNVTAYLNGGGIDIDNGTGVTKDGGNVGGHNLIENCVFYGNCSQLYPYKSAGVVVYNSNGDEIRNCYAYKNRVMGLKTYGPFFSPAKIAGSLAWGNLISENPADIHVKDGNVNQPDIFTRVETSTALGSVKAVNLANSIVFPSRSDHHELALDNIFLAPDGEEPVDMDKEFADPKNYDFRLQADSSFRKSGPKGQDRGLAAYKANIFYVSPTGNDSADGLAVSTAWKTLGRAVKNLKAGDTLYLEPGVYAENLTLSAKGKKDAPIAIRGRGKDAAVIKGAVEIPSADALKVERIYFTDPVKIAKGTDVQFHSCQFEGATTGLTVTGVNGLKLAQCNFTGSKQAAVKLQGCGDVYLSGNIFDNAAGIAVQADGATKILYSNYNSYAATANAWEIDGAKSVFADLQKSQDQQSRELIPRWEKAHGVATLANKEAFLVGGPVGKPLGIYRDELWTAELTTLVEPELHSVSATTANISWMTSMYADCEVEWGETPKCENSEIFAANRMANYSLTDLKPNTKYYFRLKGIAVPELLKQTGDSGDAIEIPVVEPKGALLTFTTLAKNAAPKTYYVAPDGADTNAGTDRKQAWKTITHAADKVNVGDTVLIAGGEYMECVRIKATGVKDAPISFRALPGELVTLNGVNKNLLNAFIAGKKGYLNFDGLYFRKYGQQPDQGWYPMFAGNFLLTQCRDINITRCFDDGRNGQSATFVAAWQVDRLTIQNCVLLNKFCGVNLKNCPDLLVENCVFASPMILAFIIRNTEDQIFTMKNNIFTDNLLKKASLNIAIFVMDFSIEGWRQDNNCYYVRFPKENRQLVSGSRTIADVAAYVENPLFADPMFAGVAALKEKATDPKTFSPDLLLDPSLSLSFADFFATNPVLLKRGIGLQQEKFKDFAHPKNLSSN